MFIKPITTPVSPLTQNYFNTISRLRGELDFSLSSLAAALIRPRIPNYTGVYGTVDYMNVTPAVTLAQDTIADKTRDIPNEPVLCYFMIPAKNENFEQAKEGMKALGCEEIIPIEKYVEQQLQMKMFAVFTHKESNSAFIFAPTDNLALYHLCWAFLYQLLPRVFEQDMITPEETEILKSLSHKTCDKFVSLCSKALSPLKAELLKYELSQCFKGFRAGKIRNAEQNVEIIRADAEQILVNYRNKIESLNNAIVLLEGLKVVNADGNNEQEQEAIDYLVQCPRLHNIRYSNGTLEYDVDTYLTNTDMMKFKNAVRQKEIYDSYRIDDDNPFKLKENRKLLLDALFNTANPELMVKIRGHIVLNITRNWMDAPRGESFDESNPILKNCLTNPHFRHHGCPGTNRSQIIECLKAADIVSAIECSIAATGSVNIGETDITFRPFVQEIFTSDKKIIHRIDGVDLTTAEALLWLTKKERAA